MRLRNKKTGQEGNFIINKDHFECVDLDYVPLYFSLSELLDEWEDYAPTEPLIKDEKIRKAVRAWAEATGTKSVNYWGHLESCQNDSSIDFQNGLGFKHGDVYTIAELCGEVEDD